MYNSRLKGILARFVLFGDPVICRELLKNPVASETSDAAVLHSSERTGRCVIHAGAVEVRHTRFNFLTETETTNFVTRENGAG